MGSAIGFFLLFVALSECGNVKRDIDIRAERSPQTRVYGGSQALENKFKFVIFSLYKKNLSSNILTCTGFLIKPDWVLLPGHCFGTCPSPRNGSVILAGGNADLSGYLEERLLQLFDFDIQGGFDGVQERRAKSVHVHGDYYFKTSKSDVALVQTLKPFEIGATLEVVPISRSKIKSNPSCSIVGYQSDTESDYNYYYTSYWRTTVKVFRDDVIVLKECRPKKEDFICIEGGKYRYTCRENYALICNGQIWGLATQSDSSLGCDDVEQDNLTELYPYFKWIEDTRARAEGAVEVTEHSGTLMQFLIIATISGVGFFAFWFVIFKYLLKNRKWCFASNIEEPAYSALLADYSSDEDNEDVIIDKTIPVLVEEST